MAILLYMPDGVPFTATQERQARAALFGGGAGRPLGGRSGFRVDTPSDVLTVTSTAWTLKPCSAMVDPGASVDQGMYGVAVTSNQTGTPTPADSTLPRKDIYYFQVNDATAGDGSGSVGVTVGYAAGQPNANPQAPALPARSFLIATVTVPQNGGGNPTVALNPARFAAAGAPLPVYSLVERDALVKYDGLTVRRLDLATKPAQVWSADASKWLTASGPGTDYTPIWAGWNWGTGGGLVGTYWVDGDRVTVRAKAVLGAGAIPSSTPISFPLPAGYPVAGAEGVFLGNGAHKTAAGQVRPLIVIKATDTAASVWAPSIPVQTPGDAGYPSGNGDLFEVKITYQTSAV